MNTSSENPSAADNQQETITNLDQDIRDLVQKGQTSRLAHAVNEIAVDAMHFATTTNVSAEERISMLMKYKQELERLLS